jgi:hypothetical protein
MSKPQFSKRDRGKKRANLPPTHGYCDACGDPVWNKGAHAEACTEIPRLRCEAYQYGYGSFSTRKQCVLPWGHERGHVYDG